MRKRPFATAALFLAVLCHYPVAAAQRVPRLPVIEFVAQLNVGRGDPYPPVFAFDLAPADPTVSTSYTSPPFINFDVPPSPGSGGLFFDVASQVLYSRTNHETTKVLCELKLKAVSPNIPANRVVRFTLAIADVGETNLNGDSTLPDHVARVERYYKVRLERGVIGTGDSFAVVDTGSQQPVPDDEARKLIAQLIDAGFSLQVNVFGELEGVQEFWVAPINVSISRLR